MSDVRIVKIFNRLGNFFNKPYSIRFRELLVLVHVLKKCSTFHIFEDQVDIYVIAKTPIKLHYIRMGNKRMQLYLLGKLIDHIKLYCLAFDDFF